MTTKINTGRIKTLISTLLADKGEEILSRFDAEDEKVIRDLLPFMLDGNQWRREEKASLGKSWEIAVDPPLQMSRDELRRELQEFPDCDLTGHFDQVVFDTVGDPAECRIQVFYPQHPEWEGGWRFEIVTTPDETEIVSYRFIAD